MDFVLTSKRVNLLRKSVLSKMPSVCIERTIYITDAIKKTNTNTSINIIYSNAFFIISSYFLSFIII